MQTAPHPLRPILEAAVRGRFPAVDGEFTVAPAFDRGIQAVVSFTGHSVIATEVGRNELVALGADGFGGATHPRVLLRLAGAEGTIGTTDALLVARGRGAPGQALREDPDRRSHPRVQHALRLREDVRVYGDDRGIVTLGRGIAGVTEMSVELDGAPFASGHGRGLIGGALDTVPEGEPLFAAVTPGNARSLRAFLAAGFLPIASVTLIQA